jgi:hypothetical protein
VVVWQTCGAAGSMREPRLIGSERLSINGAIAYVLKDNLYDSHRSSVSKSAGVTCGPSVRLEGGVRG